MDFSTKQPDLSIFDVKIRGKAQSTRGFFLAADGFDDNAISKFSGDAPRIVLMTGEDLALVLNGTVPMFDLMQAKVDAIEVLVKPGDTIRKEDSLISLESEKATMEIPATHEGVVESVKVKVGDKVSENDVILILKESGAAELTDAILDRLRMSNRFLFRGEYKGKFFTELQDLSSDLNTLVSFIDTKFPRKEVEILIRDGTEIKTILRETLTTKIIDDIRD